MSKVWIQTTMAEISEQVPGQENLDGIEQEQGEEVPPIPGQEEAPPEPEFMSETLYIQNLNDRVKLSCESFTEAPTQQLLIIWYRHEDDPEQPFSSLRKSYRCGRPPQFKNARSSVCFISRCRDCQECNARSEGIPTLREIYGRLSRSSPTYNFNLAF